MTESTAREAVPATGARRPVEPGRTNRFLRTLFFLFIVRPLAVILLGLNVRRPAWLPKSGPALVVSNHNSHLDALVLMTLFGMRRLRFVHPVAAADYFLKSRLLAWFALRIIGIVPLRRDAKGARTDLTTNVESALKQNRILILFPEGTRGEPERLEDFKTGVAHIAKRFPEVPVYPVFMHGLGKALPRGEGLLVPFICDVFVGEAIRWTGDRNTFMETLNGRMRELAAEGQFPSWD